jgi:hypothetical protein
VNPFGETRGKRRRYRCYQEHASRWKRRVRGGGEGLGFGGFFLGFLGFFLGFRGFFLGFFGVAEAEVFGVHGLKSAGPGCVAGGAWIKAPAHSVRRHPAQRAAHPRCADGGDLVELFFFARLAQGLDAGIFGGQGAAGMGQALEVAGGRLDGGAGAVCAGRGWLSGSSHEVRL